MTDNADLIAEARVIWEADDLYPDQMIPRLVMALEAADQERGQYAADPADALRDVRAEAWARGWHVGYRDGRGLE